MALKPLDCTQLRGVMAKIARYHMSQPGVKTADDVVALVKSHFPKEQADIITRDEVIDSIMSFAKKKAKSTKTAIQTQAANIMKEAKLDRATRERIDKLQKSLAGLPENPSTKKERRAVVAAVQTLRAVEADLRKRKGELERANPEQNRQRIVKAISARVTKDGDAAGIRPLVQRLARDHVADAQTRDELIDLVHADIADIVPSGWTRRETMDAISGYGEFKGLNKEEMAAKLRDLKGQMQQVGKMDDMANGMPPRKTGGERRVPSDEERRLIQQVNDMKKELGIQTTDPETQLKSALDSIKTNLKNKIADLTDQINKQQRTKRVIKRVPRDAEALALEVTRDRLKEQLDDIVGPDLDAKRQRLQTRINELNAKIAARDVSTKSKPKEQGPKEELESQADSLKSTLDEMRRIDRMLKAIADMKDQLLTGNFKESKARAVASDEVLELSIQRNALRGRIRSAIKAMQPKTFFEKVLNVGASIRSLRATGDLPPLFRQGWVGFVTHPFKGSKSFFEGLRAMTSSLTAAKLDMEMRADPDFREIERAGTFFSPIEGGDRNTKEEELMGDLVEKIPIIGRIFQSSARGYNTFLNQLSFALMKRTLNHVSPDQKNRAKVVAEIANRINDWRGRAGVGGKGGTAENFVQAVGAMFFSLRNWISRIKMATFYHILKPGSWQARKFAIAETAKFYSALYFIKMMVEMLGGEVDDDLQSGGFGKVTVGDRAVDISGQIGTELHFAAKMLWSEYRDPKGKLAPTYGFGFIDAKKGFLQIANKTRSKLAPAPAFILDILSRSDYSGVPLDQPGPIAKHTASQFIPMTWDDIAKAYQRENSATATLFSILAMAGAGQQDKKDWEIVREKQKDAQKELQSKYPRRPPRRDTRRDR